MAKGKKAAALTVTLPLRISARLNKRAQQAAELLATRRGIRVYAADVIREGATQYCTELLGPDD
jgi:hypothetical protein